jgi:hypothetical protein
VKGNPPTPARRRLQQVIQIDLNTISDQQQEIESNRKKQKASIKDKFVLTRRPSQMTSCEIVHIAKFYGYRFDIQQDALKVTLFFQNHKKQESYFRLPFSCFLSYKKFQTCSRLTLVSCPRQSELTCLVLGKKQNRVTTL